MESGDTPAPLPAAGPPKRSWQILIDYLNLVAARYLGLVIGAVRGFIIPAILSPEAYGTYKTLLLIPPYVRGGNLGAVSGLAWQIPFYKARNDTHRLEDSVRVAYTFSLGSALLACCLLGAYSFTLPDPAHRIALLVFLVYVVTEQQIALRDTYLTGFQRFSSAARLRLFQNILGTALAVAGAWLYGLMGLIVATAITGLVSLSVSRWISRLGFQKFLYRREIAKELLSVGAPMLVTGLLYNVFFTVDRLIIVRFLGAAAMGHYALAITFVGYVNDLSTLMSRVLFPRLVSKVSQEVSSEQLRRYVHLPVTGMAVLFPIGIVIVHYAAVWFFRLVFPKYQPGAAALEILAFCVLPYAHSLVYINVILAKRAQLRMVWIYPVATAVAAAVALAAVRLEWGLSGIAAANIAGFTVLSGLMGVFAERRILEGKSVLPRLARAYGAVLYAGALVLVDHAIHGPNGASAWGSIARAATVLACYLPLVVWFWRCDPELRGLLGMVKRAGAAF